MSGAEPTKMLIVFACSLLPERHVLGSVCLVEVGVLFDRLSLRAANTTRNWLQ